MFVVRQISTGEVQYVLSLGGYDEGYEILAENVKEPKDNQVWDDRKKKFVRDTKLEAQQERGRKRNRLKDPEALLQKIEELEARITALEGKTQ